MAGEREAVVVYGKPVWLATAPVDPRDLFRGDYVRLRYDISTVPKDHWGGSLAAKGTAKRGDRVYALLQPGSNGIWEIQTLTDERPGDGTFIRGRIGNCWPMATDVRYGIEAYFMQQGTAQTLEQQRNREGIQIPLEVEVALAPSGLAGIRSYRSSALGLGLDLEMKSTSPGGDQATRNAPPNRPEFTGVVTLRLLNASDKPLAIVDRPGGRSFRLQPESQWQPNLWRWVNQDLTLPAAIDTDVKVLAPEAVLTVRIDLNDPAWFVEVPGKEHPRTLKGLPDWNCWFRLVYDPPAAGACAGLAEASLIRHGSLASRRFNGMQRID
jgi:uncharacterized membrane-anchored protein